MTSETKLQHGNWRDLTMGYEEALARLPEALKNEGFGVITQIDIQDTFKTKLGKEFRRYRIFGACNPSLAHAALSKDVRVGVLLPCNVVLYEKDDGRAVVGAIDPVRTLGSGPSDGGMAEIAREVGQRLDRVLAQLSA